LYATDLSDDLVQRAKRGIYPLSSMKDYTYNYQRAGGTKDFSSYYTADAENAVLHSRLRRNVVFSQHNLVSDASFNDFHLIVCRNVMIYFGRDLRERVHGLVFESLVRFGVLVLGLKETTDFTPYAAAFEPIDAKLKMYRRVR
jgi:chemotaxis protein methyltransferase CheR